MNLRLRVSLFVIVALLLALALVAPRLTARYQRQLQAQPAAEARWQQQIQNARQRRDALLHRLDAARSQPAATATEPPAPPDLAPLTETERWVRQVKQLKQILAQHSDQSIPELALLDDHDWLSLARRVRLDTDENRQRAFAIARNAAKDRFVQIMLPALKAFLEASHGELPTDTAELIPYLDDPTLDPAMLARYEMIRSGPLSDAPEGPVIKEKNLIDELYDERINISRQSDSSLTRGSGQKRRPEAPTEEEGLHDQMEYDVNLAVRAFIKANRGALPQKPTELLPYFDPPPGPALTDMLSRPISPEEQKLFQDDIARRAAVRHRPK